jgi:hypothetical protein
MRSSTYGTRRKAALLVWGFALTLAGCDTFGPGSAPSNPGAQPSAAAPLPQPPPRKPPPPAGATLARLPPAAGEVETPPAAAPLAPPPQPTALPPPPPQLTALPPPTAPATGNLDRLIGLDQSHVAGILGSPRSRAESPPATIWRFGGANCDLDVYFYLDLQSQAMRALHYEVRSHDAPDQSAQRCYEALVNERRANAEPAAGSDSPR